MRISIGFRFCLVVFMAASVFSVAFPSPGAGQFGGSPLDQGGGLGKFAQDPPAHRTPYYAPAESKPIQQVVLRGLQQVDESRVRSMLQTREGRDYDPDLEQKDIRTLIGSGLFQNVRTSRSPGDTGLIITFDLIERPLIQYVRFQGNQKKKEKQLVGQAGLKVGDPLNRFSIEEGRRRLEEFYQQAGFSEAQVTVIEGLNPSDRGVAFQIVEGPRQRIAAVRFEGNTITSDARLKTQIQSKPAIARLFGGNVVRDEIDQDLQRLTAYYRSLGFLRATIKHQLDWNDDRTWLTITFVIEEGIRYRIRQIRFQGNQLFAADQLLAKTESRTGSFFNLERLRRDRTAIVEEYGALGYIYADVNAEPQFLEEAGWLDLVYQIQEGDQYRVGRILVNINGDERHTQRSVVLNRLSIRPGDIIDLRELRASERRLTHSQLFMHDPTQGITPSIRVKPLERDQEELAERPARPTAPTIRGQGPPHTVYRNPVVNRSGSHQASDHAAPGEQPDLPRTSERSADPMPVADLEIFVRTRETPEAPHP